ncbi:hypothetical protein Lfu02_76100 [Longispora fulva]|uniref:PPM-type phosphatase domain-containing protein n=1 Tax=Longispora fulva TaxID=619741 RepID=A0A8J7GVR6_9ACTN|nr:protein phosphatase 2C domain-containing protein [Longispora fulva]MBG6138391.1 hypothetical protein [Longispora fulva]GIG63238.1 hypothetical protein Lfu02_76100 [Longispora fulva]
MLDAVTATEPAPGGANDDFLMVTGRWALVLDGVSKYPVADIGCRHDVPWYVAHLGAYFSASLATSAPDRPLDAVLAEAIRRTAADHADECDLSNPFTPAATVAAVRVTGDRLDWLVLGDATVAWQLKDGTSEAITDDRLDKLTGGPVIVADVRRYDPSYVITVRNQPGGFWVAAADPDVAAQAYTGSLALDQVDRVGLYSDGITRLVERYGHTWTDLFELVNAEGPRALIHAVRAAEKADSDPGRWRGKPHDDATAVIARVL